MKKILYLAIAALMTLNLTDMKAGEDPHGLYHLKRLIYQNEAVSKVTDTASFFTYTKQSSDFSKPELCHVPDFLYLWT